MELEINSSASVFELNEKDLIGSPKYLVTLVHGTFANNAKWIQAESEFATQLANALGAKVKIFSFNWSGKNSHSARIKGGRQLATHLTNISNLYPNIKQIIIAHSHGGNVALYAIKELGTLPFKLKLITLATPFLNINLRDLSNIFKVLPIAVTLIGLSIIFPVLAAMFVLIHQYFFRAVDYYGNKINFEGVQLLTMFGGVLFLLLPLTIYILKKLYRFTKNYESKAYNKASVAIEKLDIKGCKDFKSLSLIFSGDEAGFLLKNFPFLATFLFKINEALNKVVEFFINNGSVIGGLLFLLTIFLVSLDGLTDIDAKEIYYVIMISVFSIVFIIFQCIICVIILLYPFSLIFKSNPLVFGWESIFHVLFLRVEVDTYPHHLNDNTLIVYKPNYNRLKNLVLRHSMIYSDPVVVQDIANWISKK